MSDMSFNRQDSTPELTLLDRVDELVSALVDDYITDADFAELEATLLTSRDARSRYIDDMQLHVDLIHHFRPRSEPMIPSLVQSLMASASPVPPTAGEVGS
jgi:hypothetical protein